MTAYPVNFVYDKQDGVMFDGMAKTEAEALQIAQALGRESGLEESEIAKAMRLTEVEVGKERDRETLEAVWAKEIKAGYGTPSQVWAGWILTVTTWQEVSE